MRKKFDKYEIARMPDEDMNRRERRSMEYRNLIETDKPIPKSMKSGNTLYVIAQEKLRGWQRDVQKCSGSGIFAETTRPVFHH